MSIMNRLQSSAARWSSSSPSSSVLLQLQRRVISSSTSSRQAAASYFSTNVNLATSSPILSPTDNHSNHNFPSYLLAAPTTHISTLPHNHLRVATETIPGSSTATVGVWIDAGSRYETIHNNGAAHFLEHMAFKGTPSRSQYQLEIEIENMGGHLNAYTSREQTVYFAKVFERDVDKAMDILADILLHSKLDPLAIHRERDVILREMKEVNKHVEELVLDHLHATAFAGSGLGRTILGSESNILSLSREDLRLYIDTHYLAPHMVIAGAGAVDHDRLVELSHHYFGNLRMELNEEQKNSDAVCTDEAKFVGSDVR